jgi:hypothetical protein
MARRGYVAAEPVADGTTLLKNFSKGVSGWQAYYLTVPAGESVHLRLRHPNEGWFRLLMMDKWGQAGRGMLQNRIPKGHPEVSFRNLSKEPQTVYVLVDDPGLMSSEKSPFEVLVTRSWKPGAQPLPPPPKAQGVWIHG